jgi:phage shock protein A
MTCHDDDCRSARLWAAARMAKLERELDDLRREYDEVLAKCDRLRADVERLRREVVTDGR